MLGALVVRDEPRLSEYFALGLSVATLVALAVGATLRRRARRSTRWAVGVLLFLGGLGVAASQNWFRGQGRYPVHPTDFFHYYVGARYFEQVGYQDLYTCSVAALRSRGFKDDDWGIRDLRRNVVVPIRELEPAIRACPERFAPDEWQHFVDDIDHLARLIGPRNFQRLLSDHGFNAPPFWVVAAKAAIRAAGNTAEGATRLIWIDTLLVALGGWILLRTFGPRTFCLAMVFLGCHTANRFGWVGGSLLRMDWWFWCVVAVALLRTRPFAAGAAWAYASALRLFPLLLGIGPLIRGVLRDRRIPRIASRPAFRMLAGAITGGLILLALSWPLGNIGAWREFAARIQTHGEALSFNHVGLKSLLSASPDATLSSLSSTQHGGDLEALWRTTREEAFQRRRVAHGLAVIAFVAGMLWLAFRGSARTTLATLSLALVPVVTALSSYYMSLLALLAVPARRRPPLAWAMMGAVVLTQLLQQRSHRQLGIDTYFDLISATDVALVAFFFAYLVAASIRSEATVTPPDDGA
ncbi:MAG: hypothetical protein IRZ16_22905 [Myxococcaceae bacterium]|nr:hypothetical protein [Myxococcaceae bacterium]